MNKCHTLLSCVMLIMRTMFPFPVFYSEVLDSLVRGYHEKISPENLILEVNSSKFAYNVTVQELNSLVVKVSSQHDQCCLLLVVSGAILAFYYLFIFFNVAAN